MSDSQTQILLDEERKRKLEMIAKEEGHSQSAAVRGMIDRRFPELFMTIQKTGNVTIDEILGNKVVGLASEKIITHAPAHMPVEAMDSINLAALQSVEEKE